MEEYYIGHELAFYLFVKSGCHRPSPSPSQKQDETSRCFAADKVWHPVHSSAARKMRSVKFVKVKLVLGFFMYIYCVKSNSVNLNKNNNQTRKDGNFQLKVLSIYALFHYKTVENSHLW